VSQVNTDTLRHSGGTLGTDVRIKNTSVYESDSGTSPTQNLVQGLCKAWIMQEDGTTVHDSFNQASLTDNGTGDYRVTLTNNMNNALFAVLQQMNPYTFTASSKTVLNGCRANHSDGQATTYYGQKIGQVAIGSHGSAQDAESAAGIVGDLA
tara:strand:- start:44 stop:499 length:456 start_codon:yes stop_codon:yes gene_type:complete